MGTEYDRQDFARIDLGRSLTEPLESLTFG
jgi:hypothetical protein